MSSQIVRSASRAATARSLLSASKNSRFYSEGRAVSAAAAVTFSGKLPYLVSSFGRAGSSTASRSWLSGAIAIPAAAYTLQEQEVHAAEMERTFIAIKPDGVQRGLISEIISRFERKGFKLVAIKIVVPSKEFAQKHYHDLKERPFFNGLCEFLSSGPVIAMVGISTLYYLFDINLFSLLKHSTFAGMGRRGSYYVWSQTHWSHRSSEIRTWNNQRRSSCCCWKVYFLTET
ncbi:hypothetical protein CISIN_1g026399mg [Citrus sinensis]|uniref:nucleoside-diphosphate kinase n=1 Tax=Citrus sinensis TaxID=2711 RepID=A0A067GMJ8_CITSI|nr:hypothetical protein CISIN_1g026399mg [Citrus sinensis]